MESSSFSKPLVFRDVLHRKHKFVTLITCFFISIIMLGIFQFEDALAASPTPTSTYVSTPTPTSMPNHLRVFPYNLIHKSKPLPPFPNGVKPLNFLGAHWQGDFRQLTYYTREVKSNGQGCTNNGNETRHYANLRVSEYASQCTNVGGGETNAGTNNENIDHISCELAWYLYYNFGQYTWSEVLVGHSMGGLIIRRTLQLVRIMSAGHRQVSHQGSVLDIHKMPRMLRKQPV